MSKPVFPSADPQEASAPDKAGGMADVSAGKYDGLFQGESDKPSKLVRLANMPAPSPEIQIKIDTPVKAENLVTPAYPPIARLAHVDGMVSVEFVVNNNGATSSITILSGHPMLRGAATDAVGKWRFPPDSVGQKIHATLNFHSNCSPEKQAPLPVSSAPPHSFDRLPVHQLASQR
jgi:TonB family protein